MNAADAALATALPHIDANRLALCELDRQARDLFVR